ncbi:MAG: AAA family ATPase [Pseudomonadota bacterium]
MRLERFDLTRYGRFTDYSLVFGSAPAGGSDFHVIYGANEAGKTTIRDAFLDLLFGIERRTRYGFLHAHDLMAIGAGLDLGEGAVDLVRIKRARDDLLDGTGRALSPTLLDAALGGIDRAGYRTMFSLDDDSLEEGGETILQSEGDLGRLLFSGASGLSTFGAVLDGIRSETDAFYRPRARTGDLAEAKRALKEIRASITEIDVQASQYRRLVEAEEATRARYEAVLAESRAADERAGALRRMADAVPTYRQRMRLLAELAPLRELPLLPEGWRAEAEILHTRQVELSERQRSFAARLERLDAEIEAILIDAAALQHASEIRALSGAGKSRFDTAEADLPARRREYADLDRRVNEMIERLGKGTEKDPRTLLLPASSIAELSDLIDRAPVLQAALATSRSEVEKADHSERMARRDLSALGEARECGALAGLVSAIREAGPDQAVETAERLAGDRRRFLGQAIAGLRPWSGEVTALQSLAVPDASTRRSWLAQADANATDLSDCERALDQAVAERERLQANLKAEQSVVSAPDDTEAKTVREARNAAWQDHRVAVADGASPEQLEKTTGAFERAMRADDAVGETRMASAAGLAALSEAEAALVRCDGAIEGERKKQARISERDHALKAIISDAFSKMGLPEKFDLNGLEPWLTKRDQALAASLALDEAESALAAARATRADGRQRLSDQLALHGAEARPEDGIAALLARAQSEIEASRETSAARKAAVDRLRAATGDAEARRLTHTRAKQDWNEWEESWAAALDDTWLDTAGEQPTPVSVRNRLVELGGLQSVLTERDTLLRRIEAMEADRRSFVDAIASVAETLDHTVDPDRTLEAFDAFAKRLDEAVSNQEKTAARQADRDAVREELRATEAETQAVSDRFDLFAERFPASDFDELLEAMTRAGRRDDLLREIAEREETLGEILGAFSDPAFSERLDRLVEDPGAMASLNADLEGAERERAELAERVAALFHEHQKSREALDAVDGDAAAARLEEDRQTLLLDVEDKARRFLTLSVGALVAESAIQSFRDKHRTAMMQRAAAAFRTITNGAFADLKTIPAKSGEVLVALRADGASIHAVEMSKGTRFQLYLALRIAGHAEFADRRVALPFFADDIMETFDDDRSAETFLLLADMATKGQVIYLTHHRHLCAVAQRICGDAVRLHELP